MFDLGWTEILIIAVIALIVIGPKDLPSALKNVAYWVRKARGLTREFQKGVDDLVREAELDDVQKEIKTFTRGDLGRRIEETIDPTGSIKKSLVVDESSKARKATTPAKTEKGATPAKIEEAAKPAEPETADAGPGAAKPDSPAAETDGEKPAAAKGDEEATGEPKSRASA
jgi:sec-independent protein translocase protein TatB